MTVRRVGADITLARRLEELGFTRGSRLDKLYIGFGGSPIAVRVSGAVIAVRGEDAARITGHRVRGRQHEG